MIRNFSYPEVKKRFSRYWVWIGLILRCEMRMCKIFDFEKNVKIGSAIICFGRLMRFFELSLT
jgi:hypothetical protein